MIRYTSRRKVIVSQLADQSDSGKLSYCCCISLEKQLIPTTQPPEPDENKLACEPARFDARCVIDRTGYRAPQAARTVHLGRHSVNLDTWEISANGAQVRLPEKSFRVLEALLEQPGQVVTRRELQNRLWSDGTVVDFDNNLNSAVATLRTSLGDSAKTAVSIETLPRLGYRLVCEVHFDEPKGKLLEDGAPDPALEPIATRIEGRSRSILVASAAGFIVVLAIMTVALFSPFEQGGQANGRALMQSSGTIENELPTNAAALAPWQRGLYLQAKDSNADKLLAVENYRETLHLEPNFAAAHMRLAETLTDLSFSGGLDLREGLAEARASAARALSLDNSLASALRVRSLASLHLDWDFAAAGRDLQSALQLAPFDAEVYLATATLLLALGEKGTAVRAAQRAVDLDPASALLSSDLGYFLVAAGRYADALNVCDGLLGVEPDSIWALGSRSIAAENLGRLEESVEAAEKIMELQGASQAELESLRQTDTRSALTSFRSWELAKEQSQENPSPLRVAVRLAGLNRSAEALLLLEQSLEERDPWLVYLNGYPQFDKLRQDPRFVRISESVLAPAPGQGEVSDLVAQIEKRL